MKMYGPSPDSRDKFVVCETALFRLFETCVVG